MTMTKPPSDTDPVTLKEACEIMFKNKVGVAALRSEAVRGRLAIFRIGRQDFTTLRDVREMIEQCRAEKPRPGSTSTKKGSSGSSATARDSSALDALNNDLRKLRAN